MHEIYKGMDNAAEQIDNNFKGIKDYVIEQGDNQKGWWEKWASGKLVQYGAYLTTHNGVTEQWGSTYLSDPIKIEYPIKFWDIYTLNVNVQSVTGLAGWAMQYAQGNPNHLVESPQYCLARPTSSTTTTHVQYDFIAIGRWKAPVGWEG